MDDRNAAAALRLRLKALEEELEELRARKHELSIGLERLAAVEADLAEVRSQLGDRRTALPLLENVRVASPCNMRWDDMVGEGRVRYCGKCEKNVYNVAHMTREEAEALIRNHDGELCMRIYRRADGTVITSDCPVGAQRKRRRDFVMAIAVGSSLAAGALYAMDGVDPLPLRAADMHPERWVVTMSEVDDMPVRTAREVDHQPDPEREVEPRAMMGMVIGP